VISQKEKRNTIALDKVGDYLTGCTELHTYNVHRRLPWHVVFTQHYQRTRKSSIQMSSDMTIQSAIDLVQTLTTTITITSYLFSLSLPAHHCTPSSQFFIDLKNRFIKVLIKLLYKLKYNAWLLIIVTQINYNTVVCCITLPFKRNWRKI